MGDLAGRFEPLFVATRLVSGGDVHWLPVLPVAVFLLLIGSADVAWSLLVLEADVRE